MSSYLYIVKSELPLVIQAFLKADPNTEWVSSFVFSYPPTVLAKVKGTWLLPVVDTHDQGACQIIRRANISLCNLYWFSQHGGVTRMDAWNWLNNWRAMTGYLVVTESWYKPSLLSACQDKCFSRESHTSDTGTLHKAKENWSGFQMPFQV